jgi:hypothetical protein
VAPVLPVDPVRPAAPLKPVAPVRPADPVKPVAPVLPVDPAGNHCKILHRGRELIRRFVFSMFWSPYERKAS